MTRTTSLLLVFGALQNGTAVVAMPVSPALVQVSVTNSVRADAAVIDTARAVTTRIFRKAGIRLAFRLAGSVNTSRSQAEAGAFHIVLAGAPKRANDVLGAADIPQRTAWLFVDNIRTTARETGVDKTIVLGHVFAHELGHLLLESPEHAVSGVMSEPLDFSRAAQGVLGFHDEQVRRMKRRLAISEP